MLASGEGVADVEEPRAVSSRSISEPVRYMLWGRAAGRCQRATCNRILWRSPISGDPVNIAEAAHIWSFGERGPRGRGGLDGEELNDVENLMLLCSPCHTEVDRRRIDHPAELLRAWKRRHEARIERCTELDDDRKTQVLVYGAPVGGHPHEVSLAEIRAALAGYRYPSARDPVQLGLVDGALRDRDPAFWPTELANLERKFRERVQEALARGAALHVGLRLRAAAAPRPSRDAPARGLRRRRVPAPSRTAWVALARVRHA